MVGKAIVVLFLVFHKVERCCVALPEEEVDHASIVETAMEIGTHAVAVGYAAFGSAVSLDSQRFICFIVDRSGYALMDFIASHLFATCGKRELRLACDFLLAHYGSHGQQTDAFDVNGVALRASRVVDAYAKHLIAATDAEDGFPLSVGFPYGVGYSFFLQVAQVVDGGLAARKDDDVGPEQLLSFCGVIDV